MANELKFYDKLILIVSFFCVLVGISFHLLSLRAIDSSDNSNRTDSASTILNEGETTNNHDEVELFRRKLINAIDEKKYNLFPQEINDRSIQYKKVLVKSGSAYNDSVNDILSFIANTKATDLYTPFLIQNVSEVDRTSFKNWDIWELSKKWPIAHPVFSLSRKKSSFDTFSTFILQHDREPGGMITVDITESYYAKERAKYNLSSHQLGVLPRIESEMLFADFLLLSEVESTTMLYGTDFSQIEKIANVRYTHIYICIYHIALLNYMYIFVFFSS
jgi:hypothetical protein